MRALFARLTTAGREKGMENGFSTYLLLLKKIAAAEKPIAKETRQQKAFPFYREGF